MLQVVLVTKFGWKWNNPSTNEDECPVCLEMLSGKNTLTTSCKHEFHEQCILRVAAKIDKSLRVCPCCRAPFFQ